jgi:serine/threonine-protein kinase HipA
LRPKCTVIDEDSALSIGKFPRLTDERAVTKGEVLALTLARKPGIDAAVARIVASETSPVALIRRFDRRGDGRRTMYITAATLLGVEATEPEDRTYAEIVDAIRVHGADAQSYIISWRRRPRGSPRLKNHYLLHATLGDLYLNDHLQNRN